MKEIEKADRGTAGAHEEAGDSSRRFGPVAAAFLAVGVGSFVLGVLTTLAEASESLKSKLEFSKPVGPLSGKTVIAVGAWAVAWAILHQVYRDKEPSAKAVFRVTAVLIGVGVLMTFPTFFLAFAPEE